jgi:exonuclease SbcD
VKILHTSDWHLGRALYGRRRYDEFSSFLDWLEATLETEKIDALIVAGDIFDTGTPSNRAQELYYRFLCRVSSSSSCRHIVISSGNHDSPSFLDAPAALLKALNVHVIGTAAENPSDEVLVLRDGDGKPELIVCAVPYLRDRDIRSMRAGESVDERNARMAEGLKRHYEAVCAEAERLQAELSGSGKKIPIAATGHLFTAGGQTVDGDGVRELYVGSLAHVEKDVFPPVIDYLALGHLHVPQRVGGCDHIRYSGSPLPMGFGEASQKKRVITVDFDEMFPRIEEVFVPRFQELGRLTGSLEEIEKGIRELAKAESRAWLEVEYTGSAVAGDLRESLEELCEGTDLEILRIRNRRVMERVLHQGAEEETLDELSETDVFLRCLDAHEVADGEREELTASYNEILLSLHEDDKNAE